MKRILGIAMVLGLVGSVTFITGCSKGREPQAKEESAIGEVAAIPKGKDITGETIKKESTVIAPIVPKSDSTVVIPVMGSLLIAPFSEAKAKEEQKRVATSLRKEVEEKEDLGKGIQLEMVLIPAGKFMMGSPKSEVGHKDNEVQHDVTLVKPFYMGKYEVTQEQWFEIMDKNPSGEKGRKLPVESVSRVDCQEFIKKLNAKTSGGYRLPTEAEWEYACRAGTSTAYSFGDNITPKDANYIDSMIGKSKLVTVGSYKPNMFGLYDMHGNVMEWCEDLYGGYPKKLGVPESGRHVLRGGFFGSDESEIRSSYRFDANEDAKDTPFGFRLARTP